MAYRLDIDERHAYYLNNISQGMMPISLNTARFLYDWCYEHRPRLILDSGSGFSSFVLRKYKLMVPGLNVRVITIDNKESWLDKTRQFLRDCGLGAEDCWSASDFSIYSDLFSFDLIFEDYDINFRNKRLKYDMRHLKNSGHIILDDMHLGRTRSMLGSYVRTDQIQIKDLFYLADKFGRFPAILKKK